MLISTDYTGKKESMYRCDRCGDPIPNPRSKRYKLDITTKNSKHRNELVVKYDLCKHCASLVNSFIKKGTKDRKDNFKQPCETEEKEDS